jgi:hypothetical protein
MWYGASTHPTNKSIANASDGLAIPQKIKRPFRLPPHSVHTKHLWNTLIKRTYGNDNKSNNNMSTNGGVCYNEHAGQH